MNPVTIFFRLAEVAWKSLTRNRLRSLLTLGGVSAGMFLYTAVSSLQDSLAQATDKASRESTLIVFQANRFCPSTSRIPEHYAAVIAKMKGVKSVTPTQVVVNNCGASLDVITFRGVLPDFIEREKGHYTVREGSLEGWPTRGDAAILPRAFADRMGYKPGQQFEAAGVKAHAVAVIESDRPEDSASIFVPLPFLQQASKLGLGLVTQFEVEVDDPSRIASLSTEIDDRFRSDLVPTKTRPRSEFFTETAGQMIELIRFSHWLGIGSIIAVLGLLSNSALLAVRGRIKEAAIMQTIGWSRLNVGALTLWEGAILGLVGGAIGVACCLLLFTFAPVTLGNEGVILSVGASPSTIAGSLAVSIILGLISTVWPAWSASRRPLADSLR